MAKKHSKIIETLVDKNIAFVENEPLKNFCTFKIGGPANIIILPKNTGEISVVIKAVRQNNVPYLILGNGSNILFSDSGFEGAIIQLGTEFSGIELIDETTVFAQSGALLKNMCTFAMENGLTGMEELYGIPGSVGGALFMNAGAYGGEIKDIAQYAEHVDLDGNFGSFDKKVLDLSYRHSVYKDDNYIITGLGVTLKKDDKTLINKRMEDILNRRITKQPLDYPSGGSTFKRPVGGYASALIDECGLKGYSVGGACVSEKHAGFVINKNSATASDVKRLVDYIKKTVKERKNICLECEIIVVD